MIRAEGFARTTKNYARTFVAAVSEEEYAVRQIMGRKSLSVDSVLSIVSVLIDQSEEPVVLMSAMEKLITERKNLLL